MVALGAPTGIGGEPIPVEWGCGYLAAAVDMLGLTETRTTSRTDG